MFDLAKDAYQATNHKDKSARATGKIMSLTTPHGEKRKYRLETQLIGFVCIIFTHHIGSAWYGTMFYFHDTSPHTQVRPSQWIYRSLWYFIFDITFLHSTFQQSLGLKDVQCPFMGIWYLTRIRVHACIFVKRSEMVDSYTAANSELLLSTVSFLLSKTF